MHSTVSIAKGDPYGGWKISKYNDDTFQLTHPQFASITHIPSFDVADQMRREMVAGGFIRFVRKYEDFIAELRKKILAK